MTFLFHPKITLAAGLISVASLCGVVVGLSVPLHTLVPHQADEILAVAATIGAIATAVATVGRSPLPSVDNMPTGAAAVVSAAASALAPKE